MTPVEPAKKFRSHLSNTYYGVICGAYFRSLISKSESVNRFGSMTGDDIMSESAKSRVGTPASILSSKESPSIFTNDVCDSMGWQVCSASKKHERAASFSEIRVVRAYIFTGVIGGLQHNLAKRYS
eukprot:scaffold113785_cov18-Prasinocladus_malaysianus.AAC.1